MLKSINFWVVAISLAAIGWLAIDIVKHNLDWQKDVREELIITVQNMYSFNKEEKAKILDKVFERNQTYMFAIYVKCFLIVILLVAIPLFLRRLKKIEGFHIVKALGYSAILAAFVLSIKILFINRINTNDKIQFLSNAKAASIQELYNTNFKGKVVYVDFWGTTCGPCLEEFRNFTAPLKEKFKQREDISYLYIAQGNNFLWHNQVAKYKVEGAHLFVDEAQYEKLYRESISDSSEAITMPRYIILNKKGIVVEKNALRPSEKERLYDQLTQYLSATDN